MKYRYLLCFVLIFPLLLVSCEKKEKALVLPPAGTATPGRIEMGSDYADQVFYDFESNKAVFTSRNDSWDLSFEASQDGYHVFMNGGKNVLIYNTKTTRFDAIHELPPACYVPGNWLYDEACGMPDSTGVGEWQLPGGSSKNEVYIAQLDALHNYKFQIQSVSGDKFVLKYATLQAKDSMLLTIPKDSAYNYSYFSFTTGIAHPEPPKDQWDVVFTRYRHVYHELNNLLYIVNGALLNPAHTAAAADSISTFAALTYDNTAALPLSRFRNVIGFDWKTYDFAGYYKVNKNKCYILHTRNDEIYKLHFLDFYSPTGEKGSPSFESERLQ